MLIRRCLLLLVTFYSTISALTVSIQTGKESQHHFSVMHLRDSLLFSCHANKDSFGVTTEITCIFDQIPSQNIGELNNNFFHVTTAIDNQKFIIRITPYKKMDLFPILFDLQKDTELFYVESNTSRHWSIVGYDEVNPFAGKESFSDTAINLPVTFPRKSLPFVGGLDIEGNPIEMQSINDVSEFIKIKEYYKKKQYDTALEHILQMQERYPHSVFKSELALYKIRTLYKLNEFDAMLEASKKFIREFSSDQNIAEVLVYTAHAYSKLGMFSDADYFYDHLFNEHAASYFSYLGYVYKADQLAESGSWKKALNFYAKVLNETDNVALASRAAFKLAQYYLNHAKRQKAIRYLDKILEGNPGYFANHFDASYDMAMALTDHGNYKMAAAIAGALLEGMTPRHERYEEVLKNRGIWLARAHDKESAIESFDRYLKTFKFGQYVDEVKREKDALFFDLGDENMSAALNAYDRIIERYPDDAIAQKALYKKAKLLYDHKAYAQVVGLQEALLALDAQEYDVQPLINGAVSALMQEHLNRGECKEAVRMSQQYDITLPDAWDQKIYFCADEAGDYRLAKKIAAKYLKSKTIPQRLEWLYYYISADFKLGNYTDVLDASKELITLMTLEKSTKYYSVYRIDFDANERLNNGEGMIQSMNNIEKVFGLDFDDIDRYAQMVALGNRNSDDVMVENYAKKVIYLQQKRSSYAQTPYIEFSLADALVKLNKPNEAIEILKSLDERDIGSEKRARQKYLLGSLLQKRAKTAAAKEAYKQSIEADKESAWGRLAQDALNLMS